MNRVICLILLLASLFPAAAVDAPSALRLPPFQKVRLDNGLTLLLMEQHEVPIVSCSILVRAGAVNDPAGKEGLASITAQLLRQGTRQRTADQISAELDFVGGELGFDAQLDYATGEAEFLKKDLRAGLDLLADVLQNAAFPKDELVKLLNQSIDALKQEKDEPQAVIGRYFGAALFGGHPYGRPAGGDERTLAAIKRSDVARFYTRWYTPATTTIAVVGDFETAALERDLRQRFGGWKTAVAPAAERLSLPAMVRGRRLLLVDKPDATQTFFMIGNVGVERTHPDRVAIEAVNTAFGGRFTSILNDGLRVNAGLTYGARSYFDYGQVPGRFAISTYTRNAATVQAIDLTLDLLQKLHREGLSEEQVQSVKAYLKGQFPPQIETTDQLAGLLTTLEFHGLTAEEVNGYFAKVDALTVSDVRRVIAQHFPSNDLVFVLVGKASEIAPAVKKYAPRVETRSISQVGFK